MKKNLVIYFFFIGFLFFSVMALINLNSTNSGVVLPNLNLLSSNEGDSLQSTWTTNGVPLCNAIGDQGSYINVRVQMCSDCEGGAFIVWADERSGNFDLYAQRIDEHGWIQWTSNGLAIANTGSVENYQQIISDGFGGAIITWVAGGDIYAQRVFSNGTKCWGSGVVVCSAASSQSYPKLCTDGSGGAIITWQDSRNPPLNADDIYAQRINSTGSPQWATNGVAICIATYGGKHTSPEICSDENGGAIITWVDNRTVPENWNIYAQKINANGETQWLANGTVICNANNDQETARLVSDGQGGAIITWRDDRTGIDSWPVYAQRIDSNGVTRWTANGIVITNYTIHYSDQYMCSDGAGGAIITWRDSRTEYNLFAQKINSAGTALWDSNGVAVCTAADNQVPRGISSDGNGGAVIVWYDMRSGNFLNPDIYAQQLNSSGNAKWDANGTAICSEGNYQDYATVLVSTKGVAFFAWTDNRSYVTNDWDLYYNCKDLVIDTQPPQIDLTLILIAIGASQPGMLDQIIDLLLSPLVLGGIAGIEFLIIVIMAAIKRK